MRSRLKTGTAPMESSFDMCSNVSRIRHFCITLTKPSLPPAHPLPQKRVTNFFWVLQLSQSLCNTLGVKRCITGSLHSKCFHLSYCAKTSLPSSSPFFYLILCHRSSFHAITLAEMFATQAILWGMQK